MLIVIQLSYNSYTSYEKFCYGGYNLSARPLYASLYGKYISLDDT